RCSKGRGSRGRSFRSLVLRTATQPSVTYPPRRVPLRTPPFLPVGNKITSGEYPAAARSVFAVVEAHGVELVPHQTQPTIGHTANLHLATSPLHMTKPCEWNDTTLRQHSVFENPPNQPTAYSIYRPDPVSVYKSTRPN